MTATDDNAKDANADAPAPETEAEPGEKAIFEAVLTPHRALPAIGFLTLMAALTAAGAAIGASFAVLGAWPVIGFFGLDIVIVYLALRWSYKATRRSEWIRLTREELEIVFLDGLGGARRAIMQPYWTRVDLRQAGLGRPRLLLRSRGAALELGCFLAAADKASLADALSEALEVTRTAPALAPAEAET